MVDDQPLMKTRKKHSLSALVQCANWVLALLETRLRTWSKNLCSCTTLKCPEMKDDREKDG